MSGKLSPPVLTNTIPAFYSDGQGIVITIPYSMNRTLSLNQIKNFAVKIKTLQSSNVLYQVSDIINFNDKSVTVTIEGEENVKKFRVGQFYKVQIAAINENDEIGYYSIASIGKYTTKPSVSIGGLRSINELNTHTYTYEGIYSQLGGDMTERVYNYRFDLYDGSNQLVETSGDLLHDSSNDDLDNPYESHDTYTFFKDLPAGETYRVIYTVITNNGLVISSPKYRITQKQTINPEIETNLIVSMNKDNGYISIDIVNEDASYLPSGVLWKRSSTTRIASPCSTLLSPVCTLRATWWTLTRARQSLMC